MIPVIHEILIMINGGLEPYWFPLPKTQWNQCVETPEIGYRRIRASAAY